MSTWITLTILTTLATARLTRLTTTDKISEPARRGLITRLGTTHPIVYLAHCPWCISIWIAAALTLTTYLASPSYATTLPTHPILSGLLITLTTAHAAAWITTHS